jgi:hypothetical protein
MNEKYVNVEWYLQIESTLMKTRYFSIDTVILKQEKQEEYLMNINN